MPPLGPPADVMPAADLGEAEFRLLYTRSGSMVWDPLESAYVFSHITESWFATSDPVVHGDCTIIGEVMARWVESIWYATVAGNRFQCVRGRRVSLGFFQICAEICPGRRGAEPTERKWIAPLIDHPLVREHFDYVKENDGDPDTTWRTTR